MCARGSHSPQVALLVWLHANTEAVVEQSGDLRIQMWYAPFFSDPSIAGDYTKGTWWDTGIGQPWDSIPTILVWTVEACTEHSEEGCAREDESLPHGEAQRALPMHPLKGWQLPIWQPWQPLGTAVSTWFQTPALGSPG